MNYFTAMIRIIINIINDITYILSNIKSIAYTLLHQKLSNFRGKLWECIVVGNGPSLNETIIKKSSFFKGKEIMCVNGFAHSKYFGIIRPKYYLLIDSGYWSKKMSKKIRSHCLKIINVMKKDVRWPMVIFLPLIAKGSSPFEILPKLNGNIKIHYFIFSEVKGTSFLKKFLLSHNFASPPAQNVLVAGIFLCLNMGFKRTYLVGADHNWHENLYVDKDNVLHVKDLHFYDNGGSKTVLSYKDAEESRKRIFNISDIFAQLSRAFYQYMELEEYSKYLGSKIYNASEKSYIDAFQRYEIPNR